MGSGDIVVNLLTKEMGKVFERYGPSTNYWYRDFGVFIDGRYQVLREKYLRLATTSEIRLFYSDNYPPQA